jgi:drug/metabolite transporter (DMT)-like permease
VIYLLFAFIAVLLTGVSQVLLKIGSGHHDRHFQIYYNPVTISGYAVFLLVVLCSLIALKGLELKLFYAIASLNYAIVALLSVTLIHERLTWQKVAAILLIILGILIFYV